MTELHRPTLTERLTSPGAILAFAALLRIALLFALGNRTYWADTKEYETNALQFLSGHGPQGGTPRAPMYPLFMALGFRLGGVGNYVAIRILQLGLAILLVHLSGQLARRIAGTTAQRLTMFAMAVSPTVVFTSGMLYPTTLYSLALVSITLCAWELADRPALRTAALLGVGITAGWLTDQVVVAPVAAVLVWLSLGIRRKGTPLVRGILVSLVVAAALAAPYLRWQQESYGAKAVFMQKAQYVLYWSRSDSVMATHRRVRMPGNMPFRPLSAKEFLQREGQLIRSQPAAYTHDVAFEFLHFMAPMPDRVQTRNRFNRGPVLWLGALYFTPILVLSTLGLFLGRVPLRDRLLAAAIVLATAAFYSLFFTQTRYRIPVEPQLCFLAALGVMRLLPGRRDPQS